MELSFGSASYTASEGGSAATVTVQIDVDPGVPSEVVFTAAGALFQTFEVEAVDDAVDDDGESVVLGFGSPLPAGGTGADPDEPTVELSDDDPRGVRASETAVSGEREREHELHGGDRERADRGRDGDGDGVLTGRT